MGFSYNDITSKSMGLKARLTSWQVSGSLRNFTTTVPGKYGVTDFGADFDYREIVVSCNIFPRHSFSALVSTLDDIAAWLDPVGGLKQLVLDDVPDRYFMARLNAAVECERLLRSSGSFDLTFFCPDPFGYAIEDETFSITEAGNSTVTRLIGNMESNPIYRLGEGKGFIIQCVSVRVRAKKTEGKGTGRPQEPFTVYRIGKPGHKIPVRHIVQYKLFCPHRRV